MLRRSVSRNRYYARSVRKSPCRGKGSYACVSIPSCKHVKGKKRFLPKKKKY